MIPPNLSDSEATASDSNTFFGVNHPPPQGSIDSESLQFGHRRPSNIRRVTYAARDALATIAEHAERILQENSFFDGPVTEEPADSLEQESHPRTPASQGFPPSNTGASTWDPLRLPRPSPRRSEQFRAPSRAPEEMPPPSNAYPRRTLSRAFSMSTQVLLGKNMPDNGDAVSLKNIWGIYAHEASEFDHRRMHNLHKSLDVRLIFSGIFSAIVTPFIVESYKLLEKSDPSQPSPNFFGPGGYKVRVNAMWFGSLILSLIAGLLSIHCKQWLDGYGVGLVFAGPASGSSEGLINACRLRQYRYQGMQKYYIPEIIGLLPVLFYGALSFFAIGLIDFLWQLNQGIAIYISVICGFVLVFHIGTTILPCFTTRSPFRTPLSNLLGNLWRGARQRCDPKGLMEQEEKLDVDGLGDELDENSLHWLMEHTQSEEVYQEALRAEREFRRQSKPSTPCL